MDGAVAHYREALKLDPRLPGLHFELAEMLNTSSDRAVAKEAEEEYKAALSANPFDAIAECRLGEIAAKRGDSADARAHYERALQIQPDSAEANLGMARRWFRCNGRKMRDRISRRPCGSIPPMRPLISVWLLFTGAQGGPRTPDENSPTSKSTRT